MAKVLVSKPQVKIEILDPKDLLRIEMVGRKSHGSNKGEITPLTAVKFIKRWAIKEGHDGMLEHGVIAFNVDKASRGFTHELVRHRIGFSFLQRSTRYVDYAGGKIDLENAVCEVVIPPNKRPEDSATLDDGTVMTVQQMVDFAK